MLLLLYPPITIIRSIGSSSSRATTASCRSCVALQIVSNARNTLGQLRLAVPFPHRRAEHLADLQRFGLEHRRLIGQPMRCQVDVGIEAGRHRVPEAIEKGAAIAAVSDVAADEARFRWSSMTR